MNGIAHSVDPDQPAPVKEQADLGLHCVPGFFFGPIFRVFNVWSVSAITRI